jgi:hypothetical protein
MISNNSKLYAQNIDWCSRQKKWLSTASLCFTNFFEKLNQKHPHFNFCKYVGNLEIVCFNSLLFLGDGIEISFNFKARTTGSLAGTLYFTLVN